MQGPVRKLGVVKLPYFHVYNGSGSRLADFASSLDPAKFKRLTDAIEANGDIDARCRRINPRRGSSGRTTPTCRAWSSCTT